MKYILGFMIAALPSLVTALTIDELNKKTPLYIDLWLDPIVIGNIEVYPQKGLFDMEEFRYLMPTIKKVRTRKYEVWDGERMSVNPINNKLRVSSGKAPISLHDNEFVRLCRLDNKVAEYFEMSASQANAISEITEGQFDPKESCLLGGDTSKYWLARYNTFYDKYGNKRGVR